jgi:hypothetical protein
VNTFGYVHANPLAEIDPMGLGRATGGIQPTNRDSAVSVRCGPIFGSGASGGVHCEVVTNCNGDRFAFGIGGAGEGFWQRITAGLIPLPYINPVTFPPPTGIKQYAGSCGKSTGCEGCQAMQCLKRIQATTTPRPYFALSQNSNSYAHSALSQCGCSIGGTPFAAVAWDNTYRVQ